MSSSPKDKTIFIHPMAVVESEKIGQGTRIWGWSHVQADVVVGEHCNIGEHCFLENGVCVGNRVVIKNGISLWEGTRIADDVFLGPHAIFTNERFPRSGFGKSFEPIAIDKSASIGAGTVILPGVRIGRYATVGAGSVVTRDVHEYTLVLGNPARFNGWMCVCGLRLTPPNSDTNEITCVCGRRYEVEDERIKIDGLVKSKKTPCFVIPTKVGIQ